MNIKYAIGLIFMFVFNFVATAQIEKEIKNYVDSNEIIINNGRKFFVETIKNGELKKSKEVFHYLMMKGEERNCSSFTYYEQLLINVAFKDVFSTLKLIESYSKEGVYPCCRNMEPIQNAVFDELRKNKPLLDEFCNFESVNAEDKGVLKILFHLLEKGSDNEEYNVMISNFNKKHSESKYANFVKHYLPAPKTKASISFSIGPKFNYLTGKLSNYFNNPIGGGFSMDFCISKVYVSMYLEGAPMKLQKPITLTNKKGDTHDFIAGDVFSRMDVGFKTGYYLIRNEKIHLAPYATLLGGGFLDSNLYTSANSTDDEFKIYDSFTPGLGVNFEYKLKEFEYKGYQYMLGSTNTSYISLKFDAGFVTIPSFKNSLAKGDMIYINFGIVWGIGDF